MASRADKADATKTAVRGAVAVTTVETGPSIRAEVAEVPIAATSIAVRTLKKEVRVAKCATPSSRVLSRSM